MFKGTFGYEESLYNEKVLNIEVDVANDLIELVEPYLKKKGYENITAPGGDILYRDYHPGECVVLHGLDLDLRRKGKDFIFHDKNVHFSFGVQCIDYDPPDGYPHTLGDGISEFKFRLKTPYPYSEVKKFCDDLYEDLYKEFPNIDNYTHIHHRNESLCATLFIQKKLDDKQLSKDDLI